MASGGRWLVCRGGHLDGQWFSAADWAERRLVHERMRASGQGKYGALDYRLTTDVEQNPVEPKIIGQVAISARGDEWSP